MTSSSDSKWLKTVRRDTSASAASSSTLNRGPWWASMSRRAASTMACRCRALSAARRSTVRELDGTW
jgi:hypothetical protein